MKTLHRLGTKQLIKNVDLICKVVANAKETFGELRNINQSDLKILTEIRILLLVLKAMNHQLNDPGLTLLH